MMDVADEIQQLKRVLGVELDRELAEALNIDASAVAAWRRRTRIPEKYRLRLPVISTALDIKPMSQTATLRRTYIFALLYLLASLLDEEETFEAPFKSDFELSFCGYRMSVAYDYLCNKFSEDLASDELRILYQSTKDEISETKGRAWFDRVTRSRPDGPQ